MEPLDQVYHCCFSTLLLNLCTQLRRLAIAGNAQDLENFSMGINKDNFTLDDIDIFLRQFDKNLIPPHAQSERDARHAEMTIAQEKVLVATQHLPNVLGMVRNDSSLRARFLDDVIDRVIAALDGLVAWIEQYHLPSGFSEILETYPRLEFSSTYLGSSFLLLNLARLGPRIWTAFFNSPAAVDLALAVWITPIQTMRWQGEIEGPYPFCFTSMVLPPNLHCPTIWFMTEWLSSRKGRQVLVNRIAAQEGDSNTLADWIVCGATKRIALLVCLVDASIGRMAPAAGAFHLLDIYQVIRHFDEEPVFDKAIRRMQAWTWIKTSIQTISDEGGDTEAVLTMIYTALFFARMSSKKKASDLYELMSSCDVMAIFLRRIQQPSMTLRELTFAISVIKVLEVLCRRPNVPRWMAGLIRMCGGDAKMVESHPQEELAESWRSFRTQLESARRIARGIHPRLPIRKPDDGGDGPALERTRLYFCDNPSVRP